MNNREGNIKIFQLYLSLGIRMPEIVSDCSNLEPAIAPFIDAANTTKWKHALSIIYLNGAILEIVEGTGIPCLVSQTTSAEATEESIDLLVGKSQTKLMPLIIDVAKLFLPKLLYLSLIHISEPTRPY